MRRPAFGRVEKEIRRASLAAATPPAARAKAPSSARSTIQAGGDDGTGNWLPYWQLGIGTLGGTARLG
jgi:hypothetical protein